MKENKIIYHSTSIENIFKFLESNREWLSSQEAKKRLEINWKNELEHWKRKSLFMRFVDQLKDMMILVLIAAAFVSAWVNIWEWNYLELFESWLILLIVIINAVIWLVQENKAFEALEALKNINKPDAKVIRDWVIEKIKSEDIVVWDIIILETWDIVPADIRLISNSSIKAEEAALTWESLPSSKDIDITLKENTPLWDRKNMLYSSSIISYWRWEWIVVATGMNTEVWKIAGLLSETEETKTPLQIQLAKTAKYLSYLVLIIAVIIFIASIINVPSWETVIDNIIGSFMTAVAIAVAAIPEGLPAVVTIVLALSVKKMSDKKAIVRNLPAVETLGSCQVICSDKTWTLTINKMTIKKLFTLSKGTHYEDTKNEKDLSIKYLLNWMILNNDTKFWENWELYWDPTETALSEYWKLIWEDIENIVKTSKRIDEIPFDSERKMMSTINEVDWKQVWYIKWAFDMMLDKCKYILDWEEVREITKEDIKTITKANDDMANDALRILTFAYKIENLEKEKLEEDMILIWLVWMIDPAREEVPQSIKTCKEAWIDVIMITWDHLNTAKAIAKKIWIFKAWDKAITWIELDKMSEEELDRELIKIKVFARVSPENKVRIVKAYKNKQLVVAMTWDWVNDAPSIKLADIWVGMWITGTDVSKWASDIVLADDNFATIVSAVEEWRKAYSNIQKSVQYLLSANIAEVLCLFIATIFLKVTFLTPIMILWVNLVTDSLPALALWTEDAEDDIMKQKPRKNGRSLFAWQTGKDIIIQWIMQTVLVMFAFILWRYVFVSWIEHPLESITMAFITLCFIQLFHAYNLRSQRKSIFSKNPFWNKYLNLSFIVWVILVWVVVLIPWVRDFFMAVPLTPVEYIVSISCAFLIIPLVEIQKLIENKLLKLEN